MYERGRVINSLMTAPTLAIKAGSSAVVKTTNAFSYKLNSVYYTKAAGDLTALTGTIADDFHCLYTYLIDSAGTVTVVKGDDVAITTALDLRTQVYEKVGSSDGKCVLGYVYIKNETAATFTAGTTALDTSGLTVNYIDEYGFEGI